MRKVKNIIYTFCAALFAAACTDGNDWVVDSSYDRLFATSESSFSITPAENAAQAEASWKATPNTTGYVIEVSTNPLSDDVPMGGEGSIVYGDGIEKITKTTYLLENLESETEYYARIKSVGDGKESHWVYYDDGRTFKTKKEQILKTPTEITDSSIKVSWEENCTVTSLRIYDGKGYDQIILLEAAELQNCSITIQGLDPMTAYTIEIYNGDRLRGTVTVNTEAGELAEVTVDNVTKNSVKLTCATIFDGYTLVTDGTIPTEAEQTVSDATTVDISGLTDNTKYEVYLFNDGVIVGKASFTTLRDYPSGYTQVNVESIDEFKNSINNIATNTILIIPENTIWDIGKVTMKVSNGANVIVWGLGEGSSKPKLNIACTLEGSVGIAEFYNLELSTTQQDSKWNKTYCINYQDDNETLGTLIVEKCDIKETGDAVRIKITTGTITDGIKINNSTFVGYRNSAVQLSDLKIDMPNGVNISNSTFAISTEGAYTFRLKNHTCSFDIDYCTFYVNKKHDIISTGSSSLESTSKFSNSLFGGTIKELVLAYKNCALTDVSECYSASDIVWSTDYGVKSITLSTSELFPDMANGSYKAVDSYSIYGDQNWN